jgi:hypothetical protein
MKVTRDAENVHPLPFLELSSSALFWSIFIVRPNPPSFRRVKLDPQRIAPPAERHGKRAQQNEIKKGQE